MLNFFTTRNVKIIRDATIHLGAPLGWSDVKAKELLTETLTHCLPIFQRLKHPALKAQESFHILRVCTLPKLVYLSRVVRPALLRDVATEFDKHILETAIHKLNLPQLTPNQLLQLRLKLKNGGLGLPAVAQTSPLAFASAFISSAETLNRPSMLGETDILPGTPYAEGVKSAMTYTRSQLEPGSDAFNLLPPEDVFDEDRGYYEAIRWVTRELRGADGALPKTQRTLAHAADKLRANSLLTNARPTDAARLLASTAHLASAWLTAVPLDASAQLSNKAFASAVRLRLGLPFTEHKVNGCVCAAEQTDPNSRIFDPRHDLSCIKLKHLEVTQRHDSVKNLIHKWATRLGASSVLEPQHSQYSQHRADIRISFPDGQDYVLDVTITNPTCPSAIQRAHSHERVLGAATQAAKAKTTQYRPQLADTIDEFVPIAAEVDGGIHDQAVNFIKRMTRLCKDDASCCWTPREAYHAIINEIKRNRYCHSERQPPDSPSCTSQQHRRRSCRAQSRPKSR